MIKSYPIKYKYALRDTASMSFANSFSQTGSHDGSGALADMALLIREPLAYAFPGSITKRMS